MRHSQLLLRGDLPTVFVLKSHDHTLTDMNKENGYYGFFCFSSSNKGIYIIRSIKRKNKSSLIIRTVCEHVQGERKINAYRCPAVRGTVITKNYGCHWAGRKMRNRTTCGGRPPVSGPCCMSKTSTSHLDAYILAYILVYLYTNIWLPFCKSMSFVLFIAMKIKGLQVLAKLVANNL